MDFNFGVHGMILNRQYSNQLKRFSVGAGIGYFIPANQNIPAHVAPQSLHRSRT